MGGLPRKAPVTESTEAMPPIEWTIKPVALLTLKASYKMRKQGFVERFGMVRGLVAHQVWWILHNCLVHPLAGLLPFKPMFALHNFTVKLATGRK